MAENGGNACAWPSYGDPCLTDGQKKGSKSPVWSPTALLIAAVSARFIVIGTMR